jgi:hypothetical protein
VLARLRAADPPHVADHADGGGIQKFVSEGEMRTKRVVSTIAVSGLIAIGAVQSAFAGLKIDLVYIENPPQPETLLVRGGGQLREIMQVAAENWERIFKHGSGNWKLTIEYGWGKLLDTALFAQEYMISERGNNPSRLGHSCILFNANPVLDEPLEGLFADPTPWDNSEYLDYTAEAINTEQGWLNIGRAFSEPTGHAVNRKDLLMIAMHEIGHALGLDYSYSGLINQNGGFGPVRIKSPRPFAGFEYFIDNGPHIDSLATLPLMISVAPIGKRQMISAADALLMAQVSLFDRPDLSEPRLDFNGDGRSIATRSVSSSSTCFPGGRPTTEGEW